ncbi:MULTISPECIES: hypothetical protein [unclassified Bradyrhizobium]|uniref:hypothetical protein n=1 Tax=unclassified Bradyrhizobium TaxID=2631580 RepID=UPI001FF7CBC3|nr:MULTISPECIES: hypothetical protein [unclassified Bradyrhizobium]
MAATARTTGGGKRPLRTGMTNIEHVEQQPDGDRDQKELHEKGPAKSGTGN